MDAELRTAGHALGWGQTGGTVVGKLKGMDVTWKGRVLAKWITK